ncbi:hypothetical protein [Streptomyces sp. NBC_01518]|uniref:hypothetical protein n=1 Tax=Streptomyces sp. NBC_01518 TaxID=2903891 RepID=UPI003870B062
MVERDPPGEAGDPEGGGESGIKTGRNEKPVGVRDRYRLGQGAVRRGRGRHIPPAAVGELHDPLVPGDTRRPQGP